MNLRWASGLIPTGLARRFALGAAGLAASAVLLVSLGSWLLIKQQHEHAVAQLGERERQFHAATVASTLAALTSRMSEVATSTILATGLVDSAGRETYLTPFLNGIRQINGVPVQVLFTDYAGKEIASNGTGPFTPQQLDWLRGRLDDGSAAAAVFGSGAAAELVAMEPLRYARTPTPEGALLYKIALRNLQLTEGLTLQWGDSPAPGRASPVAAPAVFRHLNFRVTGEAPAGRDAGDELRPQYGVILLIAFGIFSLVLLVGGRLAQALTADLERLETFARDVMSKGLTGERAQVSGAPEIRSLAASINEMLDRLSGQHATLAAEGEKLATLARALTLADRRKDEFLAMLAHELRNPLAPISSGATLLRLQASDSKQVTRTSEIISRQVQHMTKIVDDLLDVSRVTRGLVTLRNDPVDLASVVHAAVDQVQPFIHQRQHSLELRLPPHAPTVMGDHARLVQVVSNLLQNAAKYTPPRGRIVLAVTAQGESVQLTVQDNGGGIAPEFMPEIFDLFTQGARSPDRSQGGLGLGLPLVKNLVELHGGTVDAASPGLGQGSTFTVRLALAPPATPSPGRPPPPPPQGMPGGALRLMVVDDNVDAASTLAAVLEMEGHSVSVFADALSALQHAAEGFDAFILDIGLPGMDGTQLARRLRHMPPCAGAVLIALTGYGQESDRQRTAEAGFDHHLVKPVDPQQLLSLLASR